MRYPLAISRAAARLSAERPVRNAATRAGEAIFAAGLAGEVSSVFAMPVPDLFCQLERAAIHGAARPAGQFDRKRNRILDTVALKRRSQQIIQVAFRHDF